MLHDAIQVAAAAHGDQKRKGTNIPYITHPMAVALILSQADYPEDIITAGVLHDTLEDTDLTVEAITDEFGTRVAEMVQGCSEPDKTLPWRVRKQHTIEQLKTASLEIRAVSCADKLHNMRCIAGDYQEIGEQLWSRFNVGRDDQEWYYKGMVRSLCDRLDEEPEGSIFHQLKDAVEKLFSSS